MSNKADRTMGRTGMGNSCRTRTPHHDDTRIPRAEEKRRALRALAAKIRTNQQRRPAP